MAIDLPMTALAWAKERYANTFDIAASRTGTDRDGWLEDARYWELIVKDLESLAALPPTDRPELVAIAETLRRKGESEDAARSMPEPTESHAFTRDVSPVARVGREEDEVTPTGTLSGVSALGHLDASQIAFKKDAFNIGEPRIVVALGKLREQRIACGDSKFVQPLAGTTPPPADKEKP